MNKIFILLFSLLLTFSCKRDETPKPLGYMRIDFPEKQYIQYSNPNCPYSFQIPLQSLTQKLSNGKYPCWMNIHYPQYNSTIHISYFKVVPDSLFRYLEDSRTLAMKHLSVANGIQEKAYINREKKIYGVTYDFEGNTASNFQFYLTDSSNHFIRGAMYYNLAPNEDSLKPVTEYIKEDLYHLINTFSWKDSY